MRARITSAVHLSILLGSLALGCGDADPEPAARLSQAVHDGDAGPPPQCTRDLDELEALATQPRPCTEDVNCPCGAYCAFGLCSFDCLADADCGAGEECTTRGQCHAPEEPVGGLEVIPAALSFVSRDAPQRLSIIAGDTAVATVSVMGEPGLILECDPTGTSAAAVCDCPATSDDCTLTGIPAHGSAALFVRVDPVGSLPEPPAWTIRVALENEVRVVHADLMPAPLITLEGVYAGSATLVGSGLPAASGESIVGDASLPVSMKVAPAGPGWPGFYRFELRDATRALGAHSPDEAQPDDPDSDLRGLAFGIIDCSRSPCTWDVRGSELSALPYGLDSPSAEVLRREGDQLGGILRLDVRGSTAWDDTLGLRWQVSLRRVDQGACEVTCVADGSSPSLPSGTLTTRCHVGAHGDCYGQSADHLCEAVDASYDRTMSTFAPGGTCDAQTNTADPVAVPARNLVMPLPEPAITGEAKIQEFFAYHGLKPEEQRKRLGQWATSGAVNSLARCELGHPGPEPPLSIQCGPGTNLDCFALEQQIGCEPVCACVPGFPCPIQACKSCEFTVSPVTDPDVAEEHEPLICAQRYLCYQPEEAAGGDPDGPFPGHVEPSSYQFASEVMPLVIDRNEDRRSGDVYCGNDDEVPVRRLPTGAGFFSNRARERHQLQPYATDDLLARCLNDLADQPRDGESIQEVFESEGCINVPRFFRAMHWASYELAQRVKYTDEASDEQLAAQALYHRLVQQWIDIHAFVAREGGQLETLVDVVAGPVAGNVPSRAQLLDTLEAGWRRVFQGRFAHPLMRIAPAVLLEPDYRTRPYQPWLGGEENEYRPNGVEAQGIGLPASLLAGMTAYLEVLAREIEVATLGGTIAVRQAALRRASVGVRYALMAEALANGLNARAREAGTPAWDTQWEIDRAKFREAVVRLLNRSRALGEGTNPLGIEREDLPLYFVDPSTPNTQFFAASDYLLARAYDAVGDAGAALDVARGAWSDWYAQSMQDRTTKLNQQDRVDQAKLYYGEQISALCGVKDGYLPQDLLEGWIDRDRDGVADIPPGLCFLDVADSSCEVSRGDLTAVVDAAPPADLKLQVCLALRVLPGNRDTPLYDDAEMNDLIDWLASNGQEVALNRLHNATVGRDALGRVTIAGFTLTREAFFGPTRDVQVTTEDLTFCREQFPTGRLPTVDDLPEQPLARPECFQGQLGDAALGVRSAADGVSVLSSRIGDLIERYDIAIRSCFINEAAGAALQAAEEAHDAMMVRLLAERLDAQHSANRAGVWGSVFSIVGGVLSENPGMVGAGVAGIFESNAAQGIANAQFAIDLAQEKHDTEMMRIRQAAEDMTCYNEAEAHFVGFRTARLELAQAETELTRAQARFSEMQRQVASLVAAGSSAVAREEERDLPRFAHEHWLDARIDRYQMYMAWARRTAFLTVKAVEYEKQMSLSGSGLGLAILRATTPDEISAELLGLEAILGDRSLAGQTPEGAPLHVPLCRYLSAPDGVDPRSAEVSCDEETFQRMLIDPSHAAYDEDGDYLGQALPFTLMPFGAHIDAEAAERVWSVSAVIDGNANGFGFGNYAWLQLYKRNTFYSQWATGPEGRPTRMQVSTNRPCRNLFLEAGAFMETTAAGCDVNDYTAATLQTPFGDFDGPFWNDVGYSPATTELRGRGLYGDYILLIPAEEIENGLLLDRIWDIYLRFTYNRITVGEL